MKRSILARSGIALLAALGAATATAQAAEEGTKPFPNVADPKPAAVASQGGGQIAVISLERPSKGASAGAPGQRPNVTPNKQSVTAAPVNKPASN